MEMEKTASAPAEATKKSSFYRFIPTGVPCLVIVIALFWYIGSIMGVPNMLNTIMHTAHDLLLNTVFYLMGICVVTGAIGRIFVEFGVVKLLENLLRPLMKPLFNLPGVAALGATMTLSLFLKTNDSAVISKNTNLSHSPISAQRSVWDCSLWCLWLDKDILLSLLSVYSVHSADVSFQPV